MAMLSRRPRQSTDMTLNRLNPTGVDFARVAFRQRKPHTVGKIHTAYSGGLVKGPRLTVHAVSGWRGAVHRSISAGERYFWRPSSRRREISSMSMPMRCESVLTATTATPRQWETDISTLHPSTTGEPSGRCDKRHCSRKPTQQSPLRPAFRLRADRCTCRPRQIPAGRPCIRQVQGYQSSRDSLRAAIRMSL